MLPLDTQAATRVCEIADDLCTHQSHILSTTPFRRQEGSAAPEAPPAPVAASLGSALTSFLHAPTQALASTLFGSWSTLPASTRHVHPLGTALLDSQGEAVHAQGMVWLAWDDCRCLFQVFRSLEYVDALGKPTSLVDGFVSRLTAGEASPRAAASGGRRRSSNLGTSATKPATSGASKLWSWGTSSSSSSSSSGNRGDTSPGSASADSEERVRTAAWQLISNIFARATALKISAEAEEVSESDGQAVLTWFPQLEYLEIQSIARGSLRFWDSWLPNRITCLSVKYAGIDLNSVLGPSHVDPSQAPVREDTGRAWRRLVLLDLSGNPGIDPAPLRDSLAAQVPAVARLSLSGCELTDVPGSLTALYNLSWLDLHGNAITDVSDISLKLGSIVRLNLAQNHLADLSGLRRLWALEILDVAENELEEWSSVLVLRNLPSLSVLNVRGNPFAKNATEDYRPLVFSAFDHRDVPLVLDGHGPTSQERREMAKIPRMATGHSAGAPKAPDTPIMKARRPKMAFIEESAGDEVADRESIVATDAPGFANGSGAMHQSKEELPPSSPVGPLLSTLEKIPRVLRATELQAVTVASSHRRGNVAGNALASPAARSIMVKQRAKSKRRATATAINGPLASSTQHEFGPQMHAGLMHSVPSSYSSRPTSPTPSAFAPSIRMGSSAMRDPERYRRKVEMMRAEAGSSWLRAFAELQAQSPSASPAPQSQASLFDDAQDVHASVELNGQPNSLSLITRSESAQEVSRATSPEQMAGAAAAPDTQLPSFLFPRRKTARKKDIARLPHYSEGEKTAGVLAEALSPEDAASAGLAGTGEVVAATGASPVNSSERLTSSTPSITPPLHPAADVQPQPLSELQLLLHGEGVGVTAKQVVATRFQIVPLADSPLAHDPQAAGGSRVVRRTLEGTRCVYITADSIVEVADRQPGSESLPSSCPTDLLDSVYIALKVPLSSIVRVKLLHGKTGAVRVEIKAARFDSPSWIEYRPDVQTDAAGSYRSLVDSLQSAANANNAAGLSEQVYKQAECLRCSWHGYIDSEREMLDVLDSDKEFVAIAPPPTELQCPECKRSYLREFYASDERQSEEDGAQADVGDIWKQPFITRRNRSNSAAKHSGSVDKLASERRARHALHRQSAQSSLRADLDRLGGAVSDGHLPFAKASNAISLFLQLSVFDADDERLMQWVPAGLIRQVCPTVPKELPAAQTSTGSGGAGGGGSKPASGTKWGLSSFLGGAASAAEEGTKDDAVDISGVEDKRTFVIDADWRASAALAPEMSEQAMYLALSSHAVYVFSPTWDAFRDVTAAKRAEMELQPERHLGLLFSIPLTTLGRIDIGPNRQYLALHSSLLRAEEKPGSGWCDKKMQQLLATTHPAYPLLGYASSRGAGGDGRDAEKRAGAHQVYVARASALQPAQHKHRFSLFASGTVSSCVFMIRDRLACSDLLDSLVEIGYETRALDSGAGKGSGRLRAINHDVEWAMHHLVQQVFLRPSTFDAIDDDGEGAHLSGGCVENGDAAPAAGTNDKPLTVRSVADQLVLEEQKAALRQLQAELLRTRSGRQPGAMVDAASGDNVIVDKVTYEFLKLYFCVGHVPSPLCSSEGPGPAVGIQPFTLVGSPQFLYLVRERLDVWPPPVPDLRALYRKWQRIAPPTIVTSDPDTYDPKALAEELARRSNAPSSASAATSKAASTANSASPSMANQASSSPTAAQADAATGDRERRELAGQLMSSAVSQYDRVEHARPIADLRRVAMISRSVTVIPKPSASSSPSSPVAGEKHDGDQAAAPDGDVLGCAGTSWRAMLRIEFATQHRDQDAGNKGLDESGWNVWFATAASARESVEALQSLASSCGAAGDVDFCEL